MEIDNLKAVLKMMSEMFAPHIETVIHDLSKKGYPILAIYDGKLSGRKVGDESTVFGPLDVNPSTQPDKIINYPFIPPSGVKFRTSSLILRDEEGNKKYGVTINFDAAYISDAIRMLSQFAHYNPYGQVIPLDKSGVLSSESLKNEIYKIKMANQITSQHLSKKDIEIIIKNLDASKYFDKHGATSLISKELNLTRPTVYKYLRIVRGQDV